MRWLSTLLVLVLWPAAGQSRNEPRRTVQQQPRVLAMTVEPDSRSLILRSASIIIFQIEATRPAGTPNEFDVAARLIDIVKGTIQQKAGDLVRLRVTQHPVNPRFAPVGAWTPIELGVGLRLAAFSRQGTDQAAAALNDPLCEALMPADEVMQDLTFARQS